jgi:squalene synthase HpnC
MTAPANLTAAELRSGKGSGSENFPVASRLVHPRHRAIIMAFYEFVRIADDIADHADLAPDQKLAHLDSMEASLLGRTDRDAAGVTLRNALRERRLGPQHAQDLLTAFRLDVTKLRYADWDDLIGYCRYSAMPVGRFVLDVHGEDRATWRSNDALCAALQIINHLQDCGKDYHALDRVYVPQDALARAGARVEDLGQQSAGPALLACLHGLAGRTAEPLSESSDFRRLIGDGRLALEVSVIETLARHLVGLLQVRDPLSERVHLGKIGVAALGLLGITKGLLGRPFRTRSTHHAPPTRE